MTLIVRDKSSFLAAKYYATITIGIGALQFEERLPILCPNQESEDHPHEIILNGHDTHLESAPQQYWCKTCFNSFYAHTSKVVADLEINLKEILSNIIKKGHFNIKEIANRLNISRNIASKLLSKIFTELAESETRKGSFLESNQHGSTLFMDETFIKINHKTWYIIVAITGFHHVMAYRVVEQRSMDTLIDIVKDCEKRLLDGLRILVTDGFLAYIGVAQALNHPLIHIRHIHQPPYGRIVIDIYKMINNELHLITVSTTNEIMAVNGYFLTQVSEEKIIRRELKKRGRKQGSKNRKQSVIIAEKLKKEENKKKRGRPPGKRNKQLNMDIQAYRTDLRGGCIHKTNKSSIEVLQALNEILPEFYGMYITTNPIEKEFSVLKELLCFRGNRDPEIWRNLLFGFFESRENPDRIKSIIEDIEISPTIIHKMLPVLTQITITDSIPI